MTGVIYARYSSDNQREESIEGQLRECMQYAKQKGITILKNYIDRALSATTDKRPEFQQMIRDSEKRLFDVVLVWKLDRFARNRYDSAHYKHILKKNGVRVISAKEPIASDSSGILLETLLEGMAEYYSAELAEKVNRGLKENALKKKYNGGGVPTGYTIDKDQFFRLDPKTAPVVLEVFTLYAGGKTIREIVDGLNEQGIRTYRGKPMSINSVTRMLKNRRYIGEYSYKDVVFEDGIPAIVPKELFDKVQQRMAKNKKAPAHYKAEDEYLLTTKLYCGKCGAYMTGESGTSQTGRVHRYYKCFHTRKPRSCTKKNVKKDWIEDLVISETMKIVFDDALMEYLADILLEAQSRENTKLPALKQQLTKAEQGIRNLVDAIQQGIFSSSTKERLDELEATKAKLETAILQEEVQQAVFTRDQILFFLHRFRDLDMMQLDHRRQMIDTFVNAVYLYDDKVVLIFNYKEGSREVSFDDVKSSDLLLGVAPRKWLSKPLFKRFGSHFHFVLADANGRHSAILSAVACLPLISRWA